MKKRTWQKAAALIACAAMIITTPDISNLVNVSGSSYEDETTGVEFISNEAEDVEAVSEDDNGFSGTEISELRILIFLHLMQILIQPNLFLIFHPVRMREQIQQ